MVTALERRRNGCSPVGLFRMGSFEMPTTANGPTLAGDLIHNRGDQAEFDFYPRMLGQTTPGALRLLAYRNFGHMGNYEDAIALGEQTGTTPDITSVERPGAVKYGFGLNFEQALGDDGNTGLFGRLGWDDGATESFCYTECDRTISFGAQISGARWHRPDDRWGLALAANGLSPSHRAYLAAGGSGFELGDGQLSYGLEDVFETYYSHPVSKLVWLSFDYQFIVNPGCNRARGSVSAPAVRVHFEI